MDEQQASYLKQEQLYQSDEQACRTAELHWMRGQAGILARDLCENTPCPVCGSLEHPHPAQIQAQVPSEQELQALRARMERQRTALQQIGAQTAAARSRAEAAQKAVRQAMQDLFEQPDTTREQLEEAIAGSMRTPNS